MILSHLLLKISGLFTKPPSVVCCYTNYIAMWKISSCRVERLYALKVKSQNIFQLKSTKLITMSNLNMHVMKRILKHTCS